MNMTAVFQNLTTGEMVQKHVRSKSMYQARINFRAYLRSTDTLHSGDAYRLEFVEGHVGMNSALFDVLPLSIRIAQ